MSRFEDSFDSARTGGGELFELLTDALRAGPNSPQWTQAVIRLQDKTAAALSGGDATDGGSSRDEYGMLMDARRQLEVLRDIDIVHPSAQMTESVFAGVAAEAEAELRDRMRIGRHPGRWRHVAALVATAALVLFSIAAIVVEIHLKDNEGDPRSALSSARGPTGGPRGWQTFDGGMPDGWRPIGPLRLQADMGLRLSGGMMRTEQSGGLVRMDPLPPGKPFDVQATVHYRGAANVLPEVFLTDEMDSDSQRPADHGHDFIWTVANGSPGVQLPNHLFSPVGAAILPGEQATLNVRIHVNDATATVETSGGKFKFRRWNGTTLLSPTRPLFLGVRFVVVGDNTDSTAASVESVRVDGQ